MGPVVEALVLARTEHLDPDMRDAFALSGTAHILSISGFHVGVVAGLLLGLLRWMGLGRVRAEWGAVSGCWLYVLGIGAPHAAVRAVVLISLLAWARSRGRPVMDVGALASALLLLLAARPDWIVSIGFQLSFAGTAGLVLLRPPLVSALSDALPGAERDGGVTSARRSRRARIRRALIEGVGAGVAATLVTLPLVAWHFDRVSLMSVPATMAVAPAVAVAIPGVGVSLLASTVAKEVGVFLAGGTALLLEVMVRGSIWFAALPGAAVWVSREALWVGVVVSALTLAAVRAGSPRSVAPRVRRLVAVLAGSAAVMVLPLFAGRGTLEVHVIDVGQGDAVALRLPSGRWLLVDAGPRSSGFDAGARRVLPYLRRHGVRQLEAVVLTHPHLDHIGGAPAVLEDLRVRGVLDPSYAAPSSDYLTVLEAAAAAGTYWWSASARLEFELDDVRVSVLHPQPGEAEGRVDDLNDLSLVTLVTWDRASVLLTGDASAEIERSLLEVLPPASLARLSVLKVGHHGSRTSTSSELVAHTRPRVAVVSAGDGNRFGHPHEVVMERLDLSEVPVYRTDRDGDVRLVIASDGSVEVRPSR
jgi:competence protein ComEC